MAMPEKMRKLRETAGLTQMEVARRLNCTSSAVNQYETGKRTPRFAVVVKLAEIYNCSVDAFIKE